MPEPRNERGDLIGQAAVRAAFRLICAYAMFGYVALTRTLGQFFIMRSTHWRERSSPLDGVAEHLAALGGASNAITPPAALLIPLLVVAVAAVAAQTGLIVQAVVRLRRPIDRLGLWIAVGLGGVVAARISGGLTMAWMPMLMDRLGTEGFALATLAQNLALAFEHVLGRLGLVVALIYFAVACRREAA